MPHKREDPAGTRASRRRPGFSLLPFVAGGRAAANANYGGQAVLEGVMIRGPKSLAVAVRRTDGRIVLKRESLLPLTRRHPLFNVPLIRGAFALADALLTGLRALRFSADVAMEEENERLASARAEVDASPESGGVGERESGGAGDGESGGAGDGGVTEPPGECESGRVGEWESEGGALPEAANAPGEPATTHHSPLTTHAAHGSHSPTLPLSHSQEERVEVREVASGQGIPAWSLVPTLLFTSAIVVGVFVAIPDALANVLRGHLPPGGGSNVVINLVEGFIRLGLFVGYILAISRMDVIRRVFQYHGAEHQVIYAFESGDPVTPETARRYDTAHPRCGTSFLAVVVFVSILAFSFVDVDALHLRLLAKLVLLPVVGGISYEVIRMAGAGWFTFLVIPGLWLQRLTTRRPDPEQVTVAIAALQGALEQEGRSLHRASEAAGD